MSTIHSSWLPVGERASLRYGTAKPSTVISMEISSTGSTRVARPSQGLMPVRRSGRFWSASGADAGVGCSTESTNWEDIVPSTFLDQLRGTVGRSASEEENLLPGAYRQRIVLPGDSRVFPSVALKLYMCNV